MLQRTQLFLDYQIFKPQFLNTGNLIAASLYAISNIYIVEEQLYVEGSWIESENHPIQMLGHWDASLSRLEHAH